MSAALPEVTVLALGGTIAMSPQAAGGVAPRLGADELVAAIQSWTSGVRVRAETVVNVPSASLAFEGVAEVAARARAAVAAGCAGVVVTQGTDTIEETAFLLDLLFDLEAPVVVTGAMRAPDQPGADGPANLLAAVQVAASPEARGCGVLVAFNDEIHAARFVAKRHTHRPSAFVSPLAGPIGWIAEGRVTIALKPVRPAPTFPWPGDLAEVIVVQSGLGDEGRLIRALAADPPAGVVLAAMGAGHMPQGLVPALAELSAKVPVVLASRTGAGETLGATYGFPGSEIDLIGRGLIPSGALDAPKARLLLALALGNGLDRTAIVGAFAAF